jgi:ankyrin repeat protein
MTDAALHKTLSRAVYEGRVEDVRAALDAGADPNRTDADGEPLLCEAFFCDDLEKRHAVLKLLLERGANPNLFVIDEQIGDLFGPLSEAAMRRDRVALELLAAYGADPNAERLLRDTLYDYHLFDYQYEEDLLSIPDELTDADKATPDTLIDWLARVAEKYHRQPPDYLRTLRKIGAKTMRELEQLRSPNREVTD